MTPIYVEASAWAKLVKQEPESAALATFADAHLDDGEHLVSSALLETEMYRLAERFSLSRTRVADALSQVDLFLPTAVVFRSAGILPGPSLRSLDALHVAHCLDLGVGLMLSYDTRQAEAAEAVGIRVLTPGTQPR